MFVRTLLLFILFLVLVRFVWRLLRGVVEGAMGDAANAGQGPASPSAVKMAQDPICGTYVVPGKALEANRGRETLYFCSDACRTRYLESR